MKVALCFPVAVGVGIINAHAKFMIDACARAIIGGIAVIKNTKHGENRKKLYKN